MIYTRDIKASKRTVLLSPVGLADGCELVVSPAVEVDLGGAGGAVPAGLPASELHARVPGHSRG